MPANRLVLGDYNAVCDRCRFKFKASELRKEPVTHLMVCVHCFELPNPQRYIKGVKESHVSWTRPEPTVVYVSVTYSYGNGNNENTIPAGTFTV